MSGNVVHLSVSKRETAQPVMAWACNCGCAWFKLIEGGEVMCDQCGTVQTIRHFDPTDRETAP